MADMYGWDGTQWVRITVGGGGGIVVNPTPNRASFVTAQVPVPTHGNAVQFASQAIPDGFSIAVKAFDTNTGNIYIGNSEANAENHAVAAILAAGQSLLYFIDNADLIWIDSDVDDEGVVWTVET
jgi:hypothetical protein